jgi:anti-sigma B factor antagonist
MTEDVPGAKKKKDPYSIEGADDAAAPEAPPVGAAPEAPAKLEKPARPADAAKPASRDLFNSHVRDGVHIVGLTRADVLDAGYIEAVGDDIYHHIKQFDAPRVVMNLDNVRHLSSAALSMLIALKKVVEKQGGAICLANVSDDIMQIFKITKLHKLMKIHKSTDKAIESLR